MSKSSESKAIAAKKTLCDWSKKELREQFDELRLLVSNPRHACLKCGRVARCKKALCKPSEL